MPNWMKMLNELEGATDFEYNPFAPENVLKSNSPYLNWVFGKGNGLPFGYSAVLFGPPKSGKSLISYLLTAGLHRSDPNAIAIKFNTEMREAAQTGNKWGIDFKRYIGYDVNDPALIFDRFKKDIVPMLEAGMPLKLAIIDSLQGVMGVKAEDKESIKDHLRGDLALTIQEGLKMMLPIIRKYKIAFVCTEHIRANQDAGGKNSHAKKEKMAGGWAEKHFFEYYIEAKRDNSPEGQKDALGNGFESDIVDARKNKGKTAHKIFIKMDESSVGANGRSGIVTFDYEKGLINTHEEIFELAKSLNLLERPNNRTYELGNQKWSSKEECLVAIRDNPDIAQKLLEGIYSNRA